MTELDTAKFEEFISAYPIYEYRILDTSDLSVETRVRQICRQECERYGSTWACPPAVGTLEACEKGSAAMGKLCFFQCCRGFRSYEYAGNAFYKGCARRADY